MPPPGAAPQEFDRDRADDWCVEAGDTLERISFKYYKARQKWRHILADPRNAGIDARRLRPGDKIVIPALTE